MKKIIRLTESDLVRLVKKVIKEQNPPYREDGEEYVKYESESDMKMYAKQFREFVVNTFPTAAKKLDLTLYGPSDNDTIKKAWKYQLEMMDFSNSPYKSDMMKLVYKTLGEVFMNSVIRDL